MLKPAAAAALATTVALGAATSGRAAAPVYTRAATQSCLAALPNTVGGLPPAVPPRPAVFFVYAFAGHDISTEEGLGPRPRAHRQLGVWYGARSYQGMILSFFKSVDDARASSTTLAWLYGGTRVRNVVVTWDQKPRPSASVRNAVLRCLRSGSGAAPAIRRPPPASLATFAGGWGGHTRRLSITPAGRGREITDDGCCTRDYALTFQIVSVHGTLTHATAVYRVTSFARSAKGVRLRHVGDLGKLVLKDGIVTNTLTGVYFCSDPAWGATGACGA